MVSDDGLLTPGQVAALLGVNAKTVTRWAKEGKLEHLTTPGGHRRYRVDKIEALLRTSQSETGGSKSTTA